MSIAVAVIVLALVGVVLAWNLLVRRRNAVANAFAGVDAMLMLRYDLIPNLVATVKGYADHESGTLRAIAELRSQATRTDLDADTRVRLDNRISQGISSVLALAEHYPDLHASENFQQLQRALNEVEERIGAARRAYNAAVNDYNNATGLFPLSLVALAAGLKPRAYFVAPPDSRDAVGVALGG